MSNDLVGRTARAVGFLSRLPVPARHFGGEPAKLAEAADIFPVAGIVIALPAAAALLLGAWIGLPPLLAATLAVAVLVVTTGALHEDGLGDVADGFFGSEDPQRRLEIMKDSAIGSYGMLALGLSLIWRIGALSEILAAAGALQAALAMLAVAAASRAAMVWLWAALPSARPDGVAGRAGVPDRAATTTAIAAGAAIGALLVLARFGVAGVLGSGILACLALLGFRALCRARIGGRTGDTLGAAQQLAEISLLAGLVISL